MRRIASYIRGSDWWNSKATPLFAFAYMAMLGADFVVGEQVVQLLVFLVWIIGAAGFGHFLNDCFDIEADRIAGKSNIAASMAVWQRVTLLALLAVFSIAPWFFLPGSDHKWVLVGSHLILFLLYSMPPIRLKEAGLLGLFADAIYAHIIPTLLALMAFGTDNQMFDEVPEWMIASAVGLWGLGLGLRNIIGHQIVDYENDVKAGTLTFVRGYTREAAQGLMRWVLVPMEVIGFFAIAWLLQIPILIALLPLFWLYKGILLKWVWREDLQKEYGVPFLNALFNNFYEQWLSLILIGCLIFYENPLYILVALLHMVLFGKGLTPLWVEFSSIVSRITGR